MFEYDGGMNFSAEPHSSAGAGPGAGGPNASGVLKAMSPGVVDFLFRRLVAGEAAEDVQWHREGTALSVQPPGAELARRLAETDLEALTPTELFHYVRAAQRPFGLGRGPARGRGEPLLRRPVAAARPVRPAVAATRAAGRGRGRRGAGGRYLTRVTSPPLS